jgi:hypothetical protein
MNAPCWLLGSQYGVLAWACEMGYQQGGNVVVSDISHLSVVE